MQINIPYNNILYDDVLRYIFSYLSYENVLSCMSVCKSWNYAIKNPMFIAVDKIQWVSFFKRINYIESNCTNRLQLRFFIKYMEEINWMNAIKHYNLSNDVLKKLIEYILKSAKKFNYNCITCITCNNCSTCKSNKGKFKFLHTTHVDTISIKCNIDQIIASIILYQNISKSFENNILESLKIL